MKTFKQFLNEIRKNPIQNPKVSAYDALRKYKDDPQIYISFTEVEKIGLNPQSPYSTPLGIYTYNLKTAWELYRLDSTKSLHKLPFGADRPYIWVVKSKGGNGFIQDMYSGYTNINFDKDVETLKQIWIKYAPYTKHKMFVSYDFDAKYEAAKHQVRKYEEFISDIDNSDESQNDMNKRDRKMFVTKLEKYKSQLKELDYDYKYYVENVTWKDLYNHAIDTAKEKNPIMMFWNLGRLMAIRLTNRNDGIEMSTKWNWLLRQCGYTGFGDLSVRGYIHPSEPMQTVFLTRQQFNVIDKVLNKDYKFLISSIKEMIADCKKHPEHIENYMMFLYDYGNDKLPAGITVNTAVRKFYSTATFKEFKLFLEMYIEYMKSIKTQVKFTIPLYKIFDNFIYDIDDYGDLEPGQLIILKTMI